MGNLLRHPLSSGAAALLLAAAGCVTLQPGVGPDPSFAKPVERRFHAAAVLPFGGDAAVRRPAEEVAALALRGQPRVPIMPPFQVGRALDTAAASGTLAAHWRAAIEQWIATLESGSPKGGAARPPPDVTALLQSIGRVLGADALVIGFTRRLLLEQPSGRILYWEGAVTTVVLVDALTADTRALFRSVAAPGRVTGFHAAATQGSLSGAAALRAYLATEPGGTPTRPPTSSAGNGDLP